MSKNFKDMTVDEQADLCQKVADLLKENEIDAKVDIYREEVCQLTQGEVMGRTILKCEKNLPSTDAAKADKFNEAIKELTKDVEGTSIKVSSSVGVGDDFKTITGVTTLDDDQTPVDIAHTPGTVMMVDFWATWCPPCQRPMQHNQDMLDENGERWGDKVKIIGLSIDSDAATVKNHITNKKWTSPIHYWRSKSDCSDVYQVRGVPHVLIVDTHGKIVFKGHPANRKDLKQDFDDLLEGKTLEGVEGPKKEEEGTEGGEDAGAGVTLDTIKAQMTEATKFRDIGKEL